MLISEVQLDVYRKPAKLITATKSVSVADPNFLLQNAPGRLLESLNLLPGSKMEERSPGSYRFSIRGSTLRSPFGVRNVKIYLDDFSLTDAAGNTYLNILDPEILKSIEIYKGPESGDFGAVTGGTALLSTKNSEEKSFGISAGSFSHYKGKIHFAEQFKNHFLQVYTSYETTDSYRDHALHPLQQEILRHQLALATELNLPVVLHNRQAFEDLWQIVQPWQMELAATQSQLAQRPGVFHSFDGSLEIGQMLIQHHFRLGISGPVTFRNARERQQLIAKLPLEALLTETDSPYLTPDPFRGRTNEPAYIVYIAQKIADLHSQSIERVATITSHNAEQLFLWGSPN